LIKDKFDIVPSKKDVLAYVLYPKVYEEYQSFIKEYGDLSRIGSDVFFHGLNEGETCEVEVYEGKVFVIKLLSIGKLESDGMRTAAFEVNGNRREIRIKDKASSIREEVSTIEMAEPGNIKHVGASIPGTVVKILVKEGDEVAENQTLMIIEAMKMETNITSKTKGRVERILVEEKSGVKQGQLLMEIK